MRSVALQLLLPVIFLAIPIATASNLTVHFIDVGQGDATLITYESWTVLIDSGGQSNEQRRKMEAYLSELGISRINLAIATHPDPEHVGQFANLMDSLKIDQFWINGQAGTSEAWKRMNVKIHELGISVTVARRGDTFDMDDAYLWALMPVEPLLPDPDANSIVIKLIFGDYSFLFMGDANEEAEDRMLSICGLCPLSDVLKLGQHGSRSSSSEALLRDVMPFVAIISAGYRNGYGYPHQETLQRLAAEQIVAFRTDVSQELIADIIATTDGESIMIKQPSTGQHWDIGELVPPMILLTAVQSLCCLAGLRVPNFWQWPQGRLQSQEPESRRPCRKKLIRHYLLLALAPSWLTEPWVG